MADPTDFNGIVIAAATKYLVANAVTPPTDFNGVVIKCAQTYLTLQAVSVPNDFNGAVLAAVQRYLSVNAAVIPPDINGAVGAAAAVYLAANGLTIPPDLDGRIMAALANYLSATSTATYLPVIPGAALLASWGTSLKVAAYGFSAPLFRLIRASDSATLQIHAKGPPAANPNAPDLSGYAAFAAATTTKVDLVYEQNASGNDLAQTTNARRPDFNLLWVQADGTCPITFTANSQQYFVIPAALTNNGRSTTLFDVAACLSAAGGASGGNQCCASLGALWNTAGSIAHLWSNSGTIALTSINFNATNKFARSQPTVTAITSGAASQVVYQDTRAAVSLAATGAGSWVGGYVGSRLDLSYYSDQNWYSLDVFDTQLSAINVGLVKTALNTIYSTSVTNNAQFQIPGNSIVQGAASTFMQNWPRQMEPSLSRSIDISDDGIFGQTAATINTNKATYTDEFRADRTFNLIQAPEPTNDIAALTTANQFTAVVATLTGAIVSGLATITGISSTTGLAVGHLISVAGFAAGTTILSVDSAVQVTASANSSVTNASASVVFKASITGTLSSGSAVVTGIPSTTGLTAGMILVRTAGASGVPYFTWNGVTPPTTILSVDGPTQITMSANATASGATTINVTDPALCVTQGQALYTASVSPCIVAWKAGAFSVIAPTTIARSFSTAGTVLLLQLDQVRRAYNTYLASRAAPDGFSLSDFAGDSRLQDPTNTTYIADGVHPSNAGYAVMAGIQAPVVNALI